MAVYWFQLVCLSAMALYSHAYIGYNDDIPPIERLAIRSYILRNLYDTTGVEGEPATRKDEAAPATKPAIPPNTFVSGGTGEGKQHLGSDGKIPNKQVAIPEIQSGYETPPNPCPVNAKTDDLEHVASQKHPESQCACIKGWNENKEDCTEGRYRCTGNGGRICKNVKNPRHSRFIVRMDSTYRLHPAKCCLMDMPNQAEYVARYQLEGRVDGFADPFAKNQYIGGGNKRAEHVAKKSPMLHKRSAVYNRYPMQRRYNPYLTGQRVSSVVAKKAPAYANRLPVM